MDSKKDDLLPHPVVIAIWLIVGLMMIYLIYDFIVKSNVEVIIDSGGIYYIPKKKPNNIPIRSVTLAPPLTAELSF